MTTKTIDSFTAGVRTSSELRDALESCKVKHLLLNPRPLMMLQQRVNQTLVHAQLTGDNAELQIAHDALTLARQDHDRKAQLQDEIYELEQQLTLAVDREHRARRDELHEQLRTLENSYIEHAKLATIAFHDCAQICAQLGLNPHQALGKFDCSRLRPASWQGSVSDILTQPGGSLPWLQDELKARQQAAQQPAPVIDLDRTSKRKVA